MTDTVTPNLYLTGNRAPVDREVTAFDLEVIGSLPPELSGRWVRNGPNPLPDSVDPETYHWFVGDGMVHGVRLLDGKAEWYRNRWVRSGPVADHLDAEHLPGPRFGDRDHGPNTNVGGFAGSLWAMVEAGGTPVRLDDELESVAWDDFGGTLPGPFSAHPKYDPTTGELHAMTYAWPDLVDHVQYVVVGSDARVTKTVDIAVDAWIMVHDMSITPNWAVLYDLPVTVDLELAMQGRFPFRWNPDREARVGLLPRAATSDADMVWSTVDPCYVFHPMNAFENSSGEVVLDVCRYERLFENDLLGPFGDSQATLDRWTVSPTGGAVSEQRISDRYQEFPRHAPAVAGLEYRFGYTGEIVPGAGNDGEFFGATLKTDLTTGVVTEHQHGPGRGGAEPIFVPREGATSEDDGWLLVLVYDKAEDRSELVVLDAADLAASPSARVILPQRVPDGFHGNWVRD